MFKGGTAAAGATAEQDLPLSYARTLSWLSLLVIMATSLVLSFFIANSAREALLTRQENFSRLLAENLNHQIYRRFALPTPQPVRQAGSGGAVRGPRAAHGTPAHL